MTVHVRLFAGAAEAFGAAETEVSAPDVAGVLAALTTHGGPGTADVLARCAIVVDGTRAESPGVAVGPDARIDVLPPFAGG